VKGPPQEEVSAGRSREDQARAQLEAIDRKISETRVLAPTDGIITTKAIEQGELVAAGTPLLTISKTDPVKLKIYVPENELGRVHIGQAAELTIDSFTDKHFQGRVTYISPNAEFTPKNVQTKDDRVKLVFEVQIMVPNPGGELKAGITADARLVPEQGVAGK
jgi:HlyD family secretion protein